ncbi:uncharacterized protein BX663DRAFT_545740 [Cokeromyces recurvatus]|uniref:uncharacterized protein n=1 Tax=Cokeromyces recurvatus TaxID=90255 RepID=UPI0022211380|nr:uncharacterized protein BX663DRAFT_545740 [Cokeromyces recurvatus]KAI7899399.1 hypothetical protein BX663DRAFT_545740 [Cokeromyces recurvatus]
MKLSITLFYSLASIIYIASAFEHDEYQLLSKRDHGLPYNTLPSTTCAVPSTCSNIGNNVTCRCSDTITVCINNSGQYCWGSISLSSTTCPTMPTSCSSTLTGTTSKCLCNASNILCVDNANNYCYGSISGNSVSVIPLPYAAASSSGAAASSSVASSSSSVVASATSSAVPTTSSSSMSVVGFVIKLIIKGLIMS